MKNTLNFLSILLIFPPLIFSQSNEEMSFLQSLPSSVQADLLREIDAGDEPVDPKSYKGPRTTVEKLDVALERIKYELLEIEDEIAYRDGNAKNDSKLIRFGNQFFTSFQSTFSPINLPNPSPSYILDVGDVLKYQMTGLSQGKDYFDLIIERDGAINIPDLGKIFIAGLSLQDATTLIEEKVNESFVGKKVFITLKELRDINIFILGHANFPGLYTLSGNSSILAAINAAGGISENGSFRSISHKRNNKLIGNFDLYQTFIFGNTNFGNTLRDGDVIIINSTRSLASATGGVGYEAIYEMLPNETARDLLDFAGGIKVAFNDNTISIIKNNNGMSDSISLTMDSLSEYTVTNGDSLQVTSFDPSPASSNKVLIKGFVNNPGTYFFQEGETLQAAIEKAGGYKKHAYPFGGQLFRESAIKIEKEIFTKIYRDLIIFILNSSNSSINSTPGITASNNPAILQLLRQFKDIKPQGRITADFSLQENSSNGSKIFLEDGDIINIPMYKPEVYVFGEVQNPGTKAFNAEFDGNDYIDISGGFGRFASTDRVIIISPNGDTFLISDNSLFTRKKITIYPGSIIYVPRQVGKLDGINYASAIAPIFSSLALSLASLNSISN